MKKIMLVIVCFMCILCTSIVSAETIGEAKSSGVFLKDTISITAINDPDYPNIACYTTNVEIGGPNLENPSNSSITCRLFSKFVGKPTSKRNIFTKSKSPFFKSLVVDRFYDKKRNALIYLSYTKKMSGSNASHSVSAVPLNVK